MAPSLTKPDWRLCFGPLRLQGFLLDGGFRFRNLTFGTFGLLSGTCIGTNEQPFNELAPLCPEGFAFVLPGPIGRGACVSRSGSRVFGCILFLNRRWRFCLTCDPQVDNIGLLSVQPFGGSASGLVAVYPLALVAAARRNPTSSVDSTVECR